MGNDKRLIYKECNGYTNVDNVICHVLFPILSLARARTQHILGHQFHEC